MTPGPGRMIMRGIYIREILSRRLLRRVLIVPPAGLVTNWRRELRKLFTLLPACLRDATRTPTIPSPRRSRI